jgi:hypothetical protein
LTGPTHSTVAMEEHLRRFMSRTPLEILAIVLSELKIKKSTAVRLFSAYDGFLELLSNSKKRNHLKRLTPDTVRGDKIYEEMRQISYQFQDGLTDLFFRDNKRLTDLTTFYGVF